MDRLERLVRLLRPGQLLGEQGIDELQHGGLAAEVFRQRQPALDGNLLPKVAEDIRIGAAETIDRLLLVAHQEELSRREAAVAQRLDQFHLQRVGVLEFIDQQQPGLGSQPLAQVFAVRSGEQVPGADQQVGEVHGRGRPLLGFIGGGHTVGDRQQPQGTLGDGPGGLGVEGHALLDVVDQIAEPLGGVAEPLVDFLAGPGRFSAAALHLGVFADGRQGATAGLSSSVSRGGATTMLRMVPGLSSSVPRTAGQASSGTHGSQGRQLLPQGRSPLAHHRMRGGLSRRMRSTSAVALEWLIRSAARGSASSRA